MHCASLALGPVQISPVPSTAFRSSRAVMPLVPDLDPAPALLTPYRCLAGTILTHSITSPCTRRRRPPPFSTHRASHAVVATPLALSPDTPSPPMPPTVAGQEEDPVALRAWIAAQDGPFASLRRPTTPFLTQSSVPPPPSWFTIIPTQQHAFQRSLTTPGSYRTPSSLPGTSKLYRNTSSWPDRSGKASPSAFSRPGSAG